jgi:hypothetical protein
MGPFETLVTLTLGASDSMLRGDEHPAVVLVLILARA